MTFPVLPASGWVPRGPDFRGFVLFEEVPADDKAKTKWIAGMPKFLRKTHRWHGPLLSFQCRKAAEIVRKKFAEGPDPKLSAEDERMLKGDDFDPKVIHMARSAMRDFGDPAAWYRFHSTIGDWLQQVHARSPIALYVRSLVTGEASETDDGLDVVYANAAKIASLSTDENHRDRACEFMEELALHVRDDARAPEFAPCIPYAFGIDEYAQASVAILGAMTPAERVATFAPLPAPMRSALILRTDALPLSLQTPGIEELCASAFDELLETQEPKALDDSAFSIQYALLPASRVTSSKIFETLMGKLEANPDFCRFAHQRLVVLLPYLDEQPEFRQRLSTLLGE